jgi:hypothetical protein
LAFCGARLGPFVHKVAAICSYFSEVSPLGINSGSHHRFPFGDALQKMALKFHSVKKSLGRGQLLTLLLVALPNHDDNLIINVASVTFLIDVDVIIYLGGSTIEGVVLSEEKVVEAGDE